MNRLPNPCKHSSTQLVSHCDGSECPWMKCTSCHIIMEVLPDGNWFKEDGHR